MNSTCITTKNDVCEVLYILLYSEDILRGGAQQARYCGTLTPFLTTIDFTTSLEHTLIRREYNASLGRVWPAAWLLLHTRKGSKAHRKCGLTDAQKTGSNSLLDVRAWNFNIATQTSVYAHPHGVPAVESEVYCRY
jgi:hypothetical protein